MTDRTQTQIDLQYGEFKFPAIYKDGKEFFSTKAVCEILGIKNHNRAASRLEPDERGYAVVHTLGGNQTISVVTEPGLYRLIFSSRKPEAKKFQNWVFHDVLPTLRKKGFYSMMEAREITEFGKSIVRVMRAKE